MNKTDIKVNRPRKNADGYIMLSRSVNLYIWLCTVCQLNFVFCFKTVSDKAERIK